MGWKWSTSCVRQRCNNPKTWWKLRTEWRSVNFHSTRRHQWSFTAPKSYAKRQRFWLHSKCMHGSFRPRGPQHHCSLLFLSISSCHSFVLPGSVLFPTISSLIFLFPVQHRFPYQHFSHVHVLVNYKRVLVSISTLGSFLLQLTIFISSSSLHVAIVFCFSSCFSFFHRFGLCTFSRLNIQVSSMLNYLLMYPYSCFMEICLDINILFNVPMVLVSLACSCPGDFGPHCEMNEELRFHPYKMAVVYQLTDTLHCERVTVFVLLCDHLKSRPPRRTFVPPSTNAWQLLTQGETTLRDVPFPMIPIPPFSHHLKARGAKFKSARNPVYRIFYHLCFFVLLAS